ncbi:MAG: tetratricopeptide repeat protein [Verrucomicrobia bacterium]|nr:MAG: tetratricopeptide repeat protein [Verrucomicrobiota bacterium]
MTAVHESNPALTRYGRWFVGLGLLTLAAFGLRTISNSDFWLSLSCGRWIAAHGLPHADPFSLTRAQAPWMDTSWLYNWLVYWLWSSGGATLVTLTHVAVIVVAFWLLARMARNFGDPVSITFALLVSAWLLAPAFVTRPRLLTLIFPAVFMFCLSTGGRRWWPWLVLLPAEVLWANMFHTFRLGPVICLCFAAQQFARWRRVQRGEAGAEEGEASREAWLNPLLLAGGTLAVTLINPYGWELHREVMGIGLGATGPRITEDVSVFSHLFSAATTGQLVWLAAAVNIMGLLAEKRRLPLGFTLWAVLGTGLAMWSPRYALLMAVLSFPFFVLSLRAAGLFLRDAFSDVVDRQSVWFTRLAAAGILVIPAVTLGRLVSNHYYYANGSASCFGLGVSEEAYPAAVTPVLARPDFPAVAVNNPLDGGYLIWRVPQRPVFTDARLSLYGVTLLQLVSRGLAGDLQAWQLLESRLAPGAVLLNCCQAQSAVGLRNLLSTGRWAVKYFDGVTALLLRNTPENRALLQDAQLQAFGLNNLELARRAYEQRVARHWFPAHSPALIGAGNMLMVLNQYTEAEKVYTLLARGAPNMADAWLELGICRWNLKRPKEALAAVERATECAPRNALAWLWYGQVCTELGLPQEAGEAWHRAQKLNPVLAASFMTQVQTRTTNNVSPALRGRK